MPVNENVQLVNVFMVEDNNHYCEYVRRLLGSRKDPQFHLQQVSNLAEAELYLRNESPDVLLLDLYLPDSNGIDTLSKAREFADGCPIIILTSSDSEELGLESVKHGAQDYLVKQHIGNDSLVRSIRYAIQRRRSEEQTLRMAAIKDFVATLAHDMSVPMIGIQNLLDGLLNGHLGELSAGQKDALMVMKTANRDQLHIVNRLLEIYRYEAASALKRRIIKAKEFLVDCVAKFSENKQVNIRCSFDSLESGCRIWGDDEALSVMVSNLLENAVKFGGSEQEIEINAQLIDSKLVVRVHNFGELMPDEVKNGMLSKFWQGVPGKTYVAKTGLGLYLCHRIAQLHQGRITCESTLEKGTTISVKLPISGLILS